MLEKLTKIKESFTKDIKGVKNAQDLEAIRIKYFGRKSELADVLGSLKELSIEQKKDFGAKANKIRKELELFLDEKKKEILDKVEDIGKIDVTRPGEKYHVGHVHPLMKVEEEIRQIFLSMNFSVVEGPEIEEEFYNFDALNIPESHPAREMWDTFWIKEKGRPGRVKNLLRTHTSPMQIRYMEEHNPPLQIIVPGRVFRYEATDMSHEINFYQLEGLMVGKDISLANFKYIIEEFFKKFFKGQKIEFRFRPSFFPFTEPSVEVDIKLGKGKWLEVMGAGMVHKKVFDSVEYNYKEWQGFAFGVGIDRLAMIKYNIPDIRLFYSGDLRFIKQF